MSGTSAARQNARLPGYAVDSGNKHIGKTFKATKVNNFWTFVFPKDAIASKVELPLDARTTKINLIHSTLSGRIEVFVDNELSYANMLDEAQKRMTPWKVAKKYDLSPILFDAQIHLKGHDVRVTVKNASENQFKVRDQNFCSSNCRRDCFWTLLCSFIVFSFWFGLRFIMSFAADQIQRRSWVFHLC